MTACGVCRAATEALAKYMKKNEIKDRDYVVEKVCDQLPARYYSRCEKFMSIYVESLEHLIERSEKLSVICDKVGFCFANGDNSLFVQIKRKCSQFKALKMRKIDTYFVNIPGEQESEHSDSDESNESHESVEIKPKPKRPLLGADKCLFGPTYWCLSPKTMKECNVSVCS